MKKILAICLMLALVASLSAPVFATPEGFVSSPAGNAAPKVESFDPADEDCTATLVITAYADRHDLTAAQQALLQKAYDSIFAAGSDLTTLNAALAQLAKDKKIESKFLAVSDLFDIHITGCDYHEGHHDFDIVLSAETLSHFVGLLHMNKNGEWELVTDATVISGGDHLKFSVEGFSPFAIVVNTDPSAPDTGDNSKIQVYAAIMIVSVIALGAVMVILMKSKKHA